MRLSTELAFLKAAELSEVLMMPAGLPTPKRMELGPRWRSTRPTLYPSHGI